MLDRRNKLTMVLKIHILNFLKGGKKMKTGELIMYFLNFFFYFLDIIDCDIGDIYLSMGNRKV